MNSLLPIFLEGYDFVARLQEWADAGSTGPDGERRHWCIYRHNTTRSVRCDLTWSLKGQCAVITKLAKTAEEVAWLALEDAAKHQE